ncbi:MAG TPA: hypothetical protein EYN51_10265, partial [Flavobacteriales bacterium]|nr:hypothetical protein [Flavobacteriales bacterium]
SGGIRSTFEARGYTAWDPTSPAFIEERFCGFNFKIPISSAKYSFPVATNFTLSPDLISPFITL